jgi:hypothetical protein
VEPRRPFARAVVAIATLNTISTPAPESGPETNATKDSSLHLFNAIGMLEHVHTLG